MIICGKSYVVKSFVDTFQIICDLIIYELQYMIITYMYIIKWELNCIQIIYEKHIWVFPEQFPVQQLSFRLEFCVYDKEIKFSHWIEHVSVFSHGPWTIDRSCFGRCDVIDNLDRLPQWHNHFCGRCLSREGSQADSVLLLFQERTCIYASRTQL